MTSAVEAAGLMLAEPRSYMDNEGLHEGLSLLRRESPVHRVEAPGYRPFWAVTRHADIMEIEREPDRFLNAPRTVLGPIELDDQIERMAQAGRAVRSLVHIDGREHRLLRAIGADWFRPKAMRHLESRVRELAKRHVDRMAALGGECDFAAQISMDYPLYVILSLLGLPESDFAFMRTLTQELFGNADPDKARDMDPAAVVAVVEDLFAYFGKLAVQRRARPTEDIASTIANARVDGEHLSDQDTISYFIIIATAGHDTTSGAQAGGIQALAEHPDQLRRLQADPGLVPAAVDEIIRWTTPVTSFMRTATEDYTLRGVRIRAGDSLLLSYPSGNRDEDVFEDPFSFDVARTPNKHLAFGFGVHYCLGAALAKMEIAAFLQELLPRLDTLALAGQPALAATNFVGGLKRLPLRYSLKR
ncbi:cytochrome P450 [Kutzneria sp. 744]|uniref:cytochrome P450 n=1 Tax=Kutzneria sp. (strain 744) TaxID=345341 RepID=UPI0003EEBE18|nr:cytochrome P450 [Kutzneria sp. 744]EWM18019.1 cytochrome P450 [Kutzneria sp. 744]